MSPTDYIAIAALIISLFALFFASRADRREREKHQVDMETTWTAELFEEPLTQYPEIRFRNSGPRLIHKAWIDTEPIMRLHNPVPVTINGPGHSMNDGEYLEMFVTDPERITDLPDDISVFWYYEVGKLARATGRIRRLFAPLDFADERHIHNVSLTSVKREYQERQQTRERQSKRPKP